jgi:DNA-binding LacI/PurR family transcriptional regulator
MERMALPSPLKPAEPNVFALLTESLDDEYEVEVLRGAIAGAREAGTTVLCVAGGAIEDPNPDRRARNFVFDLVGSHNVAGILAVSSALGSAVGPARLSAWAERWREVPMCSLGVALDGRPCVQVDNAGGLRAAVLHLIRQHRRRRIAFIRGPGGSAEAETRFDAYQQALVEEGIEFDPKLVADGDFTKPSGASAIASLLDGRRSTPAFDALAAANDYMALGAIQELAARQLRVPEQIPVVGFDDIQSARLAQPALTTVRQPTEMLGRHGARALANLIAGRTVEPSQMLATELVVRRSCGCSSVDVGLSMHPPLSHGGSIEASFVQRRQVILAELARAGGGRLGAAGSGWESRLLDALLVQLRGADPASFARALEQMLIRVERSDVEAGVIQAMLTALRRQALTCASGDRVARERLEEALHDARVFAAAFSEQAEMSRSHSALERLKAMHGALRSAMFGGGPELSRMVASHLPELGIEACVVAELSGPSEPESSARVLFGFGPGGKLAADETIAVGALPAHGLLAHSGRTQVLMPIVLRGEPLGVMLASVVTVDGARLEELRDLFGTALRVNALVRAARP